MQPRTRYALYGTLAATGLALYASIDEPEPVQNESRAVASRADATLPELNAMDDGGSRNADRDLFAVVVPPPPPAPPPPPKIVAAVVAPPPPPPVDRFRDVRVMGMIGRGGVREVVLEVEGEMLTIGTDQPFGPDGALTIESVGTQSVNVADAVDNVTKTFTLYED